MAEPERMCRMCRGKHPKAELTRWVHGADGSLMRDDTKRLPGRGLYTCSPACADKLAKMKVKA